ncbi:MAG: HINT domain-containing protein [Oscillospiraceae bacterium]|nr:HINT domain-containing protein [Oscillospiraceae bacterium]
MEKSETELSKIPVTVYNFQVEDFHTYYVGTNGVLVHNANCKLIDSGDGTYDVELSYKDDWTPEQRIEADNKVRVLSEAETIKTTPNRGNTSASSTYKREYGNNSVLRTQDVDHVVDLQLGGQTILVT